jgi:hypothetical protein
MKVSWEYGLFGYSALTFRIGRGAWWDQCVMRWYSGFEKRSRKRRSPFGISWLELWAGCRGLSSEWVSLISRGRDRQVLDSFSAIVLVLLASLMVAGEFSNNASQRESSSVAYLKLCYAMLRFPSLHCGWPCPSVCSDWHTCRWGSSQEIPGRICASNLSWDNSSTLPGYIDSHLLGTLIGPKAQCPASALHDCIRVEPTQHTCFVVFRRAQDGGHGIVRIGQHSLASRASAIVCSGMWKAETVCASKTEDVTSTISALPRSNQNM